MGLEAQGSLRPNGAGNGSRRRPRGSANLVVLGTAVALLAPLTQTLLSGGPASASSSNVNPTGVLKYGFDLNNEFNNDFAPATEENDCSFTVTANIYQSMTTPGNSAIGGGVAQSWTVSNNSSTAPVNL